MYIVYVKHYINVEGMKFFMQEWFPQEVKSVISQQPGYVDVIANTDEATDCAHVTVKFNTEENLEKWIRNPAHDVVDLLDPYRTRNYWEAARTNNESTNPEALEWKQIQVKKLNNNISLSK